MHLCEVCALCTYLSDESILFLRKHWKILKVMHHDPKYEVAKIMMSFWSWTARKPIVMPKSAVTVQRAYFNML